MTDKKTVKPISSSIVEPLLAWYDKSKRTLPWRGNVTPYEVWVSEIMLQQTRVEAVKPYYSRWMHELPTLRHLAEASEEKVLKLWEGLGYYSRVKNLLKGARIVVEEYDGNLPCDKTKLQKLPGIGAYTAGAILSIAFGVPEPAVDGNVLRVISRIDADSFDIRSDEVRSAIAERLRPLMPKGRTADFTQALFEIGALVCLPDADFRCENCPLTAYCEAYKKSAQNAFPVRVPKPEKKVFELTVFVLRCQGKYAIKKRGDKGLLAGLYELPNMEKGMTEEEVETFWRGKAKYLTEAKHVFTHLIWNMTGYLVEVEDFPQGEYLFLSREEIFNLYPLPSAFSPFKKFLV